MRKRDKLYTVNKWNKNLFVTGGPENIADSYTRIPDNVANYYSFNRIDPFPSGTSPADISNLQPKFEGIDIKDAKPISVDDSSSLFSSINGNAALSAGVSAAAPIVGNLAYNGISGGLNSGVGSAVNGIGSAVGGAVGKVNPALGAAVTLGSAIVGGGINAAFGTGVDEKKKARNEAGIAAYNNFNSNAGGFDQLQDATSQAKVRNAYRSGFLNRGWANKRNRDALNRWIDARNFALSSIENNAENLAREQTDWALANYAAYGGELNTENMDNNYMDNMLSAGGSIHIKHPGRLTALKERTGKTEAELWAEGNPDVRKMITFARNARKWEHAYGGPLFAFGGDVQTNSSDFSTGLTHINAGGTHEENPNDGVQVGVDQEGTPNLVEEGEVIYNDYVYSDRIMCDPTTLSRFKQPKKKEITYADLAKKLEKEISERPNDPISKAAFASQMNVLAEQQERQKQEMEAEKAKEAFNSLSPEDQVGIMQYAQEMDNQEQQQGLEAMAMQEMQQNPEMMQQAMMQQQMPMEEGMSQEGYAMGGHLFGGGGPTSEEISAFYRKHPEYFNERGGFTPEFLAMYKRAAGNGKARLERAHQLVQRRRATNVGNQTPAFSRSRRTSSASNGAIVLPGGVNYATLFNRTDVSVPNEVFPGSRSNSRAHNNSSTQTTENPNHSHLNIARFTRNLVENANTQKTGRNNPQANPAPHFIMVSGAAYPTVFSQYTPLMNRAENTPLMLDDTNGNIVGLNGRTAKSYIPTSTTVSKRDIAYMKKKHPGFKTTPEFWEAYKSAKGRGRDRLENAYRLVQGYNIRNAMNGTAPSSNISSTSNTNDFNTFIASGQWQSPAAQSSSSELTSDNLFDVGTSNVNPDSNVAAVLGENAPSRQNASTSSVGSQENIGSGTQPTSTSINTTSSTNSSAQTTTAPAASTSSTVSTTPLTLRDELLRIVQGDNSYATIDNVAKWLKDNGVSLKNTNAEDIALDSLSSELLDTVDWNGLLQDQAFREALAKNNSALGHAIANNYDFGQYVPTNDGTIIKDIARGNWTQRNGAGWFDSEDPAWQEVLTKLRSEGRDDNYIRNLSNEDVESLLKDTESYRNTTEWLKNPDNALLYFNTLLNDENTPEPAKRWARQFVGTDGKWKKEFNYDEFIAPVRDRQAGTYWHSAIPANRKNVSKNFVQDKDGNWRELTTAVPEGWKPSNSYTWNDKDTNNALTYNYYIDPSIKEAAEAATEAGKDGKKKRRIAVNYQDDLLGLADLGPLISMGMMTAGVGKPNYSGLDKALAIAENPVETVRPSHIGGYYAYNPLDPYFEEIQADAANQAAQRAVANSSLPTANKNAATIALDYNYQNGVGERHRKAQAYNNAERLMALQQQKDTDKWNATVNNEMAMKNAAMRNEANHQLAALTANVGAQKLAGDAAWNKNWYGNIQALANSIGAREKENRTMNMIADLAVNNVFGNFNPDNFNPGRMFRWEEVPEDENVGAKGGKLKRKKKRGLTC